MDLTKNQLTSTIAKIRGGRPKLVSMRKNDQKYTKFRWISNLVWIAEILFGPHVSVSRVGYQKYFFRPKSGKNAFFTTFSIQIIWKFYLTTQTQNWISREVVLRSTRIFFCLKEGSLGLIVHSHNAILDTVGYGEYWSNKVKKCLFFAIFPTFWSLIQKLQSPQKC